MRLDASFVYVAQPDACKDSDRAPRGDGGPWRIDRATGRAERVGRVADAVQDMKVLGGALWLATSPAWCQRASERRVDSSILAWPLGSGSPRRIDLSSGDAVAGPFLPADDAIVFPVHGGSRGSGDSSDRVAGLVRLDPRSMERARVAAGIPAVSLRVGESVYFLDEHTGRDASPGEVDLDRVAVRGGRAVRIASDLTDPRTLLRQGNDVVVKTRDHGLRAYAVSSARPVARDLVRGNPADPWTRIGGVALSRGAVVYVTGRERAGEVRAVDLAGGADRTLAPPGRDPRDLVADDRGLFWIDVVDPDASPQRDGVFACATGAAER